MPRPLRIAVALLFGLLILLVTLWVCGALWFRLPAPEWLRGIAVGVVAVLGIVTAVPLPGINRRRIAIVFAAIFVAVALWWQTIKPSLDGDWAPDVARQVTGVTSGDLLTLTNVRDFDWRSETDFTPRWLTRSYDLAQLRSLDLVMSYWAGPKMAHLIMTFGFDNGEYLAWSVEVRRRAGSGFSPIADLFKSHPLVIVASPERDVVGVRAVIRGEDVRLFRLNTRPEHARRLLLEFVADSNELAVRPRFFNSLTSNCTTVVLKMVRAVSDTFPLDWRLIVNGFLPGYIYDKGALASGMPLEELIAASRVSEKARAAWHSPDFSRLIREGVPEPRR